jgi:hypothetical protein
MEPQFKASAPNKIKRNWMRFVWLFGGWIGASGAALWWVEGQLHLGSTQLSSSVGGAPGALSSEEVSDADVEETTYEHAGERYVLIQGKYYKYKSDHVYDVDGDKVFFQDNGAAWYRPAVANGDAETEATPAGHRVRRSQHAKTDYPEPSLKVYTPQGYSDLMGSVEKAKAQMEKHNQELNRTLKNVDIK